MAPAHRKYDGLNNDFAFQSFRLLARRQAGLVCTCLITGPNKRPVQEPPKRSSYDFRNAVWRPGEADRLGFRRFLNFGVGVS